MTRKEEAPEEPAITHTQGRLSIYMGIIKRAAELTQELSNARSAATGLVKTGQAAVEHPMQRFRTGKERRSARTGP
jgi:hypothetical protein